jgi:uncharacterized protein YbjT (DUF2867 family)
VVGALVRSGRQVRAFDIASDVEQLAGAGVADVMVGDLLDPADLHRAVEGVSVVVYIGPPMHPREVEMGHGVVSAARHAGVEHFVQFSVTHPQLELLLNHQAKLEVERCVLLSRMPFTILQPMHYMQNIDVGQVVAERVLSQPYSLDTRLDHVDLEDVAEVAAKVVGDPHHHYATYELCGRDFRNAHELARIIADEAEQEITVKQIELPGPPTPGIIPSEEDDHRHDAMFRLFDHYGRYGITGNPNVLGWLLGRAPTGFDQYVRRCLVFH